MQATTRASAEHCDAVYTALIYSYLVLSREHKEKLLGRGLDPVTIQSNGYVSTPRLLMPPTSHVVLLQ